MNKKIISLALLVCAIALTGASCGQKYIDGGIFRSEDYGENWAQKTYVGQAGRKTVTISGADIRKLIFHPQEIITTDNGDFSKTGIIYAATYQNGIYKSVDGGESWQPTYFSSGLFTDLILDPQQPDTLYASSGNIIYKSSDGGQSWENIYTETKGGLIMKLLIDHYRSNHVYAFTSVRTVLESNDAGANWHLLFQTESFTQDAQMSPFDSRIIFIRDDGGRLYRTLDGGATWDEPLRNSDHLAVWPNASSVNSFSLDPNHSSTILMSCSQGLLRSQDLGTTWHQINTLIANQDGTNAKIKNITVTPGKPEVMYFSILNLIHKSDDGGQTWRVLETFPSQREVHNIYVDPVNPAVIYVGTKAFAEDKNGFLPG